MEEQSNQSLIFTIVGWIEKVSITAIAIGLALHYIDIAEGKELLRISLVILAVSLFINAYKQRDLFSSQEEADAYGQFGFSDMLGLIILPKILGIASAVCAFGLFLYLSELGNDGYALMLNVGGLSILIASFFLGVVYLGGTKKLNTVVPILSRAVTLSLVGMYLLYG